MKPIYDQNYELIGYTHEYDPNEKFTWGSFAAFIIVIAILIGGGYLLVDYYRIDTNAAFIQTRLHNYFAINKEPLIDYNKYYIINTETVNCKDWAVAFVTLYGDKAKVIGSYNHLFVKIGNKTLEPQGRGGSFGYRISTASYAHEYEVILTEEDKQIIRNKLGG